MEGATVRAQSGFEYLSTYTWALLIITIVLGLFYFFTILPNTIAPNYCSFQTSISCKDFVAGDFHGNTDIAFVLVNLQEYPINQPRVLINIDKSNYTSQICAYGNIPTGGSFICSITLPKSATIPPRQRLQANLYLVAQYCGTSSSYISGGNCTNSTFEYYPGILTTMVGNLTNSEITLSLSAVKSVVGDNGTHDGLNATVSVFGSRISGASVSFSVNGSGAELGSTSAITSSSGEARNYIYSTEPGEYNITASYSTYNASIDVTFSKIENYSIIPYFVSKTGSIGGLAGDMLNVDGTE
ncbi:MAG: Ig-like domain-containing protein, partial [Candidatus Micrarchaeaceae archaeon]